MKCAIIFALAMSLRVTCTGQELVTVRDTVNHFEIGVPVGWRYGVPIDKSLAFMAHRQRETNEDVPRENFNINILHHNETDLDNSYAQFLKSVGKADGFRIVDQGERVINGRKYKCLLESHKNSISQEAMSNYVLFANNDGKILILTMVTTTENFEKFKDLFDAIASSLNY